MLYGLVMTLLLVFCFACGRGVTPIIPKDALLAYNRVGGFVGYFDRLVIYPDGRCELEAQRGDQEVNKEFEVDAGEISLLNDLMRQADFMNLGDNYLYAEHEGGDVFEYVIAYRIEGKQHTVNTMDYAIPGFLQPIIDELNGLISRNTG